jgi:NAD(P)-dependent dehydrogenase (short-subunit alcohol dehydrogenase family)
MDLSGKAAVVTGAGRGIGRAVALALAGQGAEVAILYRKKPEPAAEVVAEIEKLGRKAEAYMCDVSDQEKVGEVFSKIKDKFGRIDVLVNAAGLASWGNFIADTTFLEWDKIMKADIYGPYNCIKEVLPVMREQKGGHIINISSSITVINPPTGGPYAVAKAGLEALTKVLAAEETGRNIHVNAIAPGLVETDMGRKLVGVDDLKKIYSTMPFGRVCQPEDLANLVLFLISEKGGYIQGQVIYLNGGKTFL